MLLRPNVVNESVLDEMLLSPFLPIHVLNNLKVDTSGRYHNSKIGKK